MAASFVSAGGFTFSAADDDIDDWWAVAGVAGSFFEQPATIKPLITGTNKTYFISLYYIRRIQLSKKSRPDRTYTLNG